MYATDAGDLELERRLDSYARARLAPDPRAVARIRARVTREARLQHDAARIAAYVAPAVARSRRAIARRAAMPLLAAGVWLTIAAGTLAASQAGGPLYPTRLWIEQATLPAASEARVSSEIERLDDRIGEALGAANAGDRNALAAALNAYAEIAEDVSGSSADNATLVSRVEQALGRHQAVLAALLAGLGATANDTAAAAIERNLERAIAHNATVLETLGAHPQTGSPSGGGGSGATGGDARPGAGGPAGKDAGPTPPGGGDNGASGANGGGNAGGNGGGGAPSGGGKPGPAASVDPGGPDHSPRGGG